MVVGADLGCDLFGFGVESAEETGRNNWFPVWVRGISRATHLAHCGGRGRNVDSFDLFGHLDWCHRNRDFDYV